MTCQVESDLATYHSGLERADSAFDAWEDCFEFELKLLKSNITGGLVKFESMTEVQECIEQLEVESKNFEFDDRSYDFSEDLNDFLHNL